MGARHKLLLVDDDPDLLDMYREMLQQLPSRPEIQTASSGARALAMLEGETYNLMVCDLIMPKLDGLQVLAIVRRKYPKMRTVALTSVTDEEFRARAYALGIDLFWNKPATEPESRMLLECLDSLLNRESEAGFRGVQSKSLVDIIQLECLSQNSCLLRITNGSLSGSIWIQDGDIIDAQVGELSGEAAFFKILSWRAGNFETLRPEPDRPRTITKSYDGLLLESAQAVDEARSETPTEAAAPDGAPAVVEQAANVEGMEFVLALVAGEDKPKLARGLENPESMITWARQRLEGLRSLGDKLQAGRLQTLEALGSQRHIVLTSQANTDFCVGWHPSMTREDMQAGMKQVLALWGS